MPVNTLVDDTVQYCTTDDVERYIRNKSFDGTSDPTATEVDDMILGASEEVDDFTRRAWRTRKVAERELEVQMDHSVESAFERKRRLNSPQGFLTPIRHWVQVYLPHQHIINIDSGQGDEILVLEPESTNDITADGGTRSEDSEWYLDGRKGILHIDPTNFRVGPVRGAGMIQDPSVRVTYRYGLTSSDTDADNVPDDLPRAVRTATARLVAADLIDSDQYGAVLASGPENTPDQSTASQRLREEAWDALQRYRDSPVML
ncbi:hypothetical protein M197_gp42 [Haloarcula hispanica tailed virus 2]|uniref:Uncharacterized protein n=1 Tax=Haloarcula hispanica tailed virus 2 TaxID=1273751 RepID=R4TKK7_9CAUD|nr:hypothetical protein M197_gp42 [Haloarcula hispanica tailed virus 2]AGM11207.1 hypothetical protein HHTV2_42 [Haloarcula hispanica tailed virus 2]